MHNATQPTAQHQPPDGGRQEDSASSGKGQEHADELRRGERVQVGAIQLELVGDDAVRVTIGGHSDVVRVDVFLAQLDALLAARGVTDGR